MTKTNFKRLTILSAASLVAVSASALVITLGDKGTTLTKGAEVTHDENCVMQHYDAVNSTLLKHGSREFWACCTHWGSHLLSKPSWDKNITDKGAFTGEGFDELTVKDDRYIPSLSESTVVYDASATDLTYNENNYKFTCDSSTGTDENYGAYRKLANVQTTATKSDDQNFWAKPTVDKDVSKYSYLEFWVKVSMNANLKLWSTADWGGNGLDAVDVTKDTWTKITVNVSDKVDSLYDFAPAIWEIGNNTFDFYMTSIYGYGLTPFETGTEKIFDVTEKQYTPLYWNIDDAETGSKAEISSGHFDSVYGEYCLIDVKKSAKSDAIWVQPFDDISLSTYSKIVFYVYSNQNMDSFGICNADYGQIAAQQKAIAGWNRVEIDLTSIDSKITHSSTKNIGIKYWYGSGVTIEGLIWKITSIYGVKSA